MPLNIGHLSKITMSTNLEYTVGCWKGGGVTARDQTPTTYFGVVYYSNTCIQNPSSTHLHQFNSSLQGRFICVYTYFAVYFELSTSFCPCFNAQRHFQWEGLNVLGRHGRNQSSECLCFLRGSNQSGSACEEEIAMSYRNDNFLSLLYVLGYL